MKKYSILIIGLLAVISVVGYLYFSSSAGSQNSLHTKELIDKGKDDSKETFKEPVKKFKRDVKRGFAVARDETGKAVKIVKDKSKVVGKKLEKQ